MNMMHTITTYIDNSDGHNWDMVARSHGHMSKEVFNCNWSEIGYICFGSRSVE